MMRERLCGGRGIGAFNGLKNGKMAPRGRQQVALTLGLGDLEPMVVDQAAMQDRLKGRKVGIPQQTPVEIPVMLSELVFVSGPGILLHRIDQPLEIGDKCPAWPLEGPDHATAFDRLAEPEHLDRFIGRAIGNPRTAVCLPDDQPLLLKLKEGFPHGPLAAPEGCGEIEFDEGRTRWKLTQHDVSLNGLVDLARLGWTECRRLLSPLEVQADHGRTSVVAMDYDYHYQ
jgi:hypothetical protein